MAGPKLVEAFADRYPEALFVEIGSNDGDHHDHLSEFIQTRSWRGVMVEPVPVHLREPHQALRRHRGRHARERGDRRQGRSAPVLPLAKGDRDELERLPYWYHGTGSFSRDQVLGHRKDIPDVEERIVERQVTALTFDSLAAKHGLEDLDLLLDRHRGLRLGDSAHDRPPPLPPAARDLRALPPLARGPGGRASSTSAVPATRSSRKASTRSASLPRRTTRCFPPRSPSAV